MGVKLQLACPEVSAADEQLDGRERFPLGPETRNVTLPASGVGVTVAVTVSLDPLCRDGEKLSPVEVCTSARTEDEPEAGA